jgi:hypothetical protein
VARRISIDEAFRKLRPALGPNGAIDEMNKAMQRYDKRVRLFCNRRVVDPDFIRDHLIVKGPGSRSHPDRPPRQTAEIVATRALDKPVEKYTWKMDGDEIEALKPQPDTKAEAMQAATAAATAAAEAARAEAAATRAELERARAEWQAATERMEKAEARAHEAEAQAEAMASKTITARRRPGKKPAHPEWRFEVAAEAHRLRTEHGEIPSAGDLAQWYYDKTDWQPDESDIRDLLRFLIRK